MMPMVWPKMSLVQKVLNRGLRGDRVMVKGNFNARVGKNVEMWIGVIGGHCEDVENDSEKAACFRAVLK